MKRAIAQWVWDWTEWLPLPELIEWPLSEWAYTTLKKTKG